MKTVYKFPIPTGGRVRLPLPNSAHILHVAEQDGKLCLWFMLETLDNHKEGRVFEAICTGQEVPDNSMYQGTALLQNGALVLHVFEVFR